MPETESFFFEQPSDEEITNETESESEEEEQKEEIDGEKDLEINEKVPKNKKTQSPWDFSSYSESVADEHSRRSTTSIDYKISKAREELPIATLGDEDSDDNRDSEPHHQEEFRPEEEDDLPTTSGNDAKPFFSQVEGVSFHANSFLDLHISRPLLRACEALGYNKPTPIQAACIPLALTGRDICGSALTGSGKTAAFALPTLERLIYRPKHRPAIRVLILTPTRESAFQVHSMIGKLAQFITDIRCCLVIGGLSTKVQGDTLRSLPDIVVATPGRMIDHLFNTMSVHLDELDVLILDDADYLLEMRYNAQIRELLKFCPERRQTMLFSATMTRQVDKLSKLSLNNPLRLSDPSTEQPATLTEEVVRVRRRHEGNEEAVLLALCFSTYTSKVIVFSRTGKEAHRLRIIFELVGLKAAELHEGLTQFQRVDALKLFMKQEVDFLIATDVANRGLDIIGVQTVINFACPRDITSYVHRVGYVGRTVRSGLKGNVVTFVTDNVRSHRILMKSIFKRAVSRLRSRIVAERSITRWSQIIEQWEEQVSSIIQQEREEIRRARL